MPKCLILAGAQEKTALLFKGGHWLKPLGTTATTHILKPQIGHLPNGIDLMNSVENEFFCLKLTKALGIPSAEVDIMTFGDKRVLVVERFDRRWTKDGRLLRLPQEDFCQALSVPPHLKYESDGGPGIPALLQLLKASDTPEADQAMLIKAAAVFWLIGATDGHAKNFSIQMAPGGRFHLAPLYDVLSAEPSFERGQIQHNKMKLAMAVGKSRHFAIGTIVPRHFIETASRAGIGASTVERVFGELEADMPRAVTAVMNALPNDFPQVIGEAIVTASNGRLRLLR